MQFEVLIVGAGQLGSRYLQGLKSVRHPLRVAVVDSSGEAIRLAQARWEEAASAVRHLRPSFHDRVPHARANFTSEPDLVIVATGAEPRPRVVAEVSSLFAPRNWILEKVLAQSSAELHRLVGAVHDGSTAVVNTPQRIWAGYARLREELEPPIAVDVGGSSWGLASNAIHLMDLVGWLSSESVDLVSVDQQGAWYPTKRLGYFDLLGCIEARFDSGSSVGMTSRATEQEPLIITIHDAAGERWIVDEGLGSARSDSGMRIPIEAELQSEMTTRVVEGLLSTGGCGLPSLESSARMHAPLLDALVDHWNMANGAQDDRVPIT